MSGSIFEKLWAWRAGLGLLAVLALWPVAPQFAPPLVGAALLNWVMVSRKDPERNPWDATCLLMGVVVLTVHFQLITRGGNQLFGVELLSAAFDSLAASLLQGSAEVGSREILWEGMEVDGRHYMYFGPWPALLRIPLGWLEPGFIGHWSRLSCFTASVLSLCGFGLICARALERNSALEQSDRRLLLLVSIFGFGLGSPLLFLMFSGWIYHEAVLWGFCGSIWSIHLALCVLQSTSRSLLQLTALSFTVGAALLSRATYGAPLYGVLAIVAWVAARRPSSSSQPSRLRDPLRIGACLLPALLMLMFQLWYNFDRFGAVTTFAEYDRLEYLVKNRASWESFEQWGAVNPRRIPTALSNYFGVQGDYFSSDFPWVKVARPSYPDLNLYPQMFQSFVVSLSIVSSWIVFPAAFGWLFLIRRRRDWPLKLCGMCLLGEGLLVSGFFIMEQRYAVDFFPALILGYAFFLGEAFRDRPLPKARRALGTAMLVAVVFSGVATLSSTLSAIPVSGPAVLQGYKAFWVQRFRAINASIDSFAARAVPEDAPAPGSPEAP